MKRKMFRKLLASLLAASMVVSMAACGNEDEESRGGDSATPSSETPSSEAQPSEETPSDSAEPSEEEDLGAYTIRTDADGNKIDLGGIHIVVRDWSTDPNAEVTQTAFGDARDAYREWLQETYNFTLEQKAISTWESVSEDFANYVTEGGDDNYYLFFVKKGPEAQAAMKNGLMYDLNTIEGLDLGNEKWHQGVNEMFSLGDKTYGMRYNEGIGGRGVYFNKRILKDAGIEPDDLYKWQAAGEWTWEKFEEVCAKVQQDNDNDGVPDVYGMACRDTIWYEIIVHTNNGNFIDMDENGNLVNALETSETMEALNWALDIWTKYDAHLSYPSDANWDYFLTAYKEGKGCFYPGELWRASELTSSMDDELGFVCFPKGPKADDYVNPVADDPCVIPACYDAEKAWKIAFAYVLWTEPVPEFEDYATWKVSGYNDFDDTESVDDTVSFLMSHPKTTYNVIVGEINLADDIFYQIKKENTAAQIAETVRSAWQAKLDAVNNQ